MGIDLHWILGCVSNATWPTSGSSSLNILVWYYVEYLSHVTSPFDTDSKFSGTHGSNVNQYPYPD